MKKLIGNEKKIVFYNFCTQKCISQPKTRKTFNEFFLMLPPAMVDLLRLDSNIDSKSSNNTYLNIIEILFL